LFEEAAKLGARAARRKPRRGPLPPLFFVTDPVRIPDPVTVAERLPRGSGIIYRGFGDPNAVQIARDLMGVARRRGLLLLIGADAALAAKVGAHGVHLPERALATARRIRRPGWIVTGAAHSARALAASGLDAFVLSAIFPSRSSSAGRPLGPIRLARLVRQAAAPVYALGGVNADTVRRLANTGIVGVAAVEGVEPQSRS
jgi:thiamine-phosphate pyrophosphorylase